jgi:hypothetical protein
MLTVILLDGLESLAAEVYFVAGVAGRGFLAVFSASPTRRALRAAT